MGHVSINGPPLPLALNSVRKVGSKLSMDKGVKCKTCLSTVDELEGEKDWEAS